LDLDVQGSIACVHTVELPQNAYEQCAILDLSDPKTFDLHRVLRLHSVMWRGKGDPAITATAIAVLCVALLVSLVDGATEGEELTTQLSNGFTAAHAAGKPVLYAPSGAFALGFLHVGAASLDLAVVPLPSSFPVWRATLAARFGNWPRPATLTFDDGIGDIEGKRRQCSWRFGSPLGSTTYGSKKSRMARRRGPAR
jgi:hypothetical protein